MSPDLKYLVWSTALMLAQMLIAVSGATLQVGLPTLAGDREAAPSLTGWAGRARRAQLNMLENIVPFAILVLVAAAAGKANATTALGAAIFFWARLVYVPVYLFGIPWARTGIWGVSVVGMVMIFLQLL